MTSVADPLQSKKGARYKVANDYDDDLLGSFVGVFQEASRIAGDCCVREALSSLASKYLEIMLPPASSSPLHVNVLRDAEWANYMLMISEVFDDLSKVVPDYKPGTEEEPSEVDAQGYAVAVPSNKLKEVVKQLDALLDKHGADLASFKCIVFVKTRSGVKRCLEMLEGKWGTCEKELLPMLEKVRSKIVARKLVGKGSGTVHETLHTQQETVDKFRKIGSDQCNCLIATSVAEEGLDFPECNAVIRADAVSDDVALVQSKGRVRSTGDYIVIIRGEKQRREFDNATGDDSPPSRLLQHSVLDDACIKVLIHSLGIGLNSYCDGPCSEEAKFVRRCA